MNNHSVTAMRNAEFMLSIARGIITSGVARMDCPASAGIIEHIEEAERLIKEDISEVETDG